MPDSRINSMTYPEKLRAVASIYERNEREMGERYALGELRITLNSMSNQALQEQQAIREKAYG